MSENTKNTNFYAQLLPFCIWLIPVTFFAYQFILRLWPGLMMQQMTYQLSIGAELFGTLAASYYYGYSVMQIPVAILLERYGAGIVICVCAILCSLAWFIFFYTHNYYIALASRFCIGACSAAGFIGVSKVTSELFDRSAYAKMLGFSFTFGLTGAIFGQKPIVLLIQRYSAETVAIMLGMICMLIGIFAFVFLKASTPNNTVVDSSFNLNKLKSILTLKILLLAIANALISGSVEGFADVWGIEYLVTAYNMKKDSAAFMVSFIFCGMLLGGPALSLLNTKIKEHATIIISGITITMLLVVILYNVTAEYMLPYIFFLAGIACCSQVIVFVLGSKMVSHDNIGICVAFLNTVNMLGRSFYSTTIGMAMDVFWGGAFKDHQRLYELETYQYALNILLLGAITGSIMVAVLGYLARKMSR